VAVATGADRVAGVVGVDEHDPVAEDGEQLVEGLGGAGRVAEVVAGGLGVAGVHAHPEAGVVVAGGQQLGHLVEPGGQRAPGRGGQLQDQAGAGDGVGQGQQRLPGAGQTGGPPAGQGLAGVDDHPGGSDGGRLGQGGRDHLAGPLPGGRVGAGEVDQVGGVHEQRAQPGVGDLGPEPLVGGRVDRRRGPAAGVGHEHLQRLAADGPGVADRLEQAAGDRDMGPDAHVRAGSG
jgi:hypothetical protein